MNTIGSVLSRLRIKVKALKKDAFITDRYLFSLVKKFAPSLIRREDGKSKLMSFLGIFETLPYVELIEVDKVETKCFKVSTGCIIKRTKEKIPSILSGYMGPLIKSIYSISGPATSPMDEDPLQLVDSAGYNNIVKSKNFKYNKTKYCWFSDGYLWFPDLEWDAVRLEGIFDEDITKFNCESCPKCIPRQEQFFNIPEYLLPELENFIWQDLIGQIKIPSDNIDDNQNILK